MWTSIVAVIGTLAGALVSGLLQHRVARTERSDARADQLRHDRMDAVTALARSVSDHRLAMWAVRDAELTGQPAERVQELRDESHRTRSEITDPAVRLKLLFTDDAVRAAAHEAAQVTYRMRRSTDLDQLQSDRAAALAAHDDFVNVCGDFLA